MPRSGRDGIGCGTWWLSVEVACGLRADQDADALDGRPTVGRARRGVAERLVPPAVLHAEHAHPGELVADAAQLQRRRLIAEPDHDRGPLLDGLSDLDHGVSAVGRAVAVHEGFEGLRHRVSLLSRLLS